MGRWKPQKYWNKDWLYQEYVIKQRSTGELAKGFGCTDVTIFYWLKKHSIPTRTISEARKVKHWGLSGKDNPMYGRRGKDSHRWKGGISSERQSFYESQEWKQVCCKVWARDNSQCQRCEITNKETKRTLHIHHVVSFAVKELRAELSNLLLLCRNCHSWVHSKKNTQKEFIKDTE